jgi:uncharacterized membrane protein
MTMASAQRESPQTDSHPADQVQRNIASIAQLENAAFERRSPSERLSSAIAGFAGTMTFVLLHLVWLGAWILVNHPASPLRFDLFPYSILILVLAVEAILLSTFVLITQNHMTRRADRLAHLNLQINLLAESEMTKMLDTLRTISIRLGLPDAADDEVYRDLSRETHVEHVVHALQEQLPDPDRPPANA